MATDNFYKCSNNFELYFLKICALKHLKVQHNPREIMGCANLKEWVGNITPGFGYLNLYVNSWRDQMDFWLSEKKMLSLTPLKCFSGGEWSQCSFYEFQNGIWLPLLGCLDFHIDQNGKKIKEKIKEKIEEKINYLSCRLEGCFLEKLAVCLAKIAAVAGFDLLCFNLHCHWTKEWHLSCCHHHAESSKWNSVCLAILLSKTSFHLSDPPKSPRFFIPVRFRLWMKVSFSKSLCWRFLSSNGKNHLNSWIFSHLVN